MKTKISYYAMAALLVFGLGLTSCAGDNSGENTDGTSTSVSESISKIPKENKKAILDAYLLVKDALVATDGDQTGKAANGLVTAIGTGDEELIKAIRFDAEHIAETSDVGLQRDHFESLSANIYKLVKGAELGEKLYRQYCPMAFEGKGAFWISSESEIMNPYFGDVMLHCGKVEEEI